MLRPELLNDLCCPETKQRVKLADPALITNVNQKISAGQARNRGGEPVAEKIDAGLLREDGKFLYPVRRDIPIMLIDEAIPL
jgi:uncharacterized protein YbaR (Trm112 family)